MWWLEDRGGGQDQVNRIWTVEDKREICNASIISGLPSAEAKHRIEGFVTETEDISLLLYFTYSAGEVTALMLMKCY